MDTNKMPSVATARREIRDNRNTSLLRIGVVFLAVVSFFTTANGMEAYIFRENKGVAYAASAAIQSILLALSMNLPKYLQDIWNAGRKAAEPRAGNLPSEPPETEEVFAKKLLRVLTRLLLCGIVIALTIVTILSSSWFSYVYIADVIHKDSWDTDSELLVQQTYRTELYGARDYAHSYRTYLEEGVGQDIMTLEQQAQEMSDSLSGVEVNWQTERESYAADGGTAASYMLPAIQAMDNAMQSGASQESRDLAATAIADAKENISSRIETVQVNLDRINANLVNYNTQITNLTNRINRATEETDTAMLTASINAYTRLINSATQQQIELQRESIQLDRALLRLPFYESLLGLSNSTSSIAIRSRLLQMQSEFFKQDPDEAVLLEAATDIFDDLRSAVNVVAESGNAAATEEFSYTNLLIQMNRLIRNLTDYSEIKEIETNLDQLIADLWTIAANVSDVETEQQPASGEAVTDTTLAEQTEAESDVVEQGTEQTVSEAASAEQGEEQTGMDTGADESGTGEAPTADADGQAVATEGSIGSNWREQWRIRLETLKAQISAMPVYSELEENTEGTVRAMTETQAEVLRGYDRNASSAALDEMIRRYISDHNAIYQGIIYLRSPYKMLAIFALCLALAFDISGFVFGFVMQGEAPENREEGAAQDTGNGRADWTILKQLHQYGVLTGNFNCKDGTYYYRAFCDGLREDLPVKAKSGENPYGEGIYILNKSGEGESEEIQLRNVTDAADREAHVKQGLAYTGESDGPRDGVFENCRLTYQEGALYRQVSDDRHFICSTDERVPVHCYDPAAKESRSFPVKRLAERPEFTAKTAVVALNEKGTRVSAIYIIKGTES